MLLRMECTGRLGDHDCLTDRGGKHITASYTPVQAVKWKNPLTNYIEDLPTTLPVCEVAGAVTM